MKNYVYIHRDEYGTTRRYHAEFVFKRNIFGQYVGKLYYRGSLNLMYPIDCCGELYLLQEKGYVLIHKGDFDNGRCR